MNHRIELIDDDALPAKHDFVFVSTGAAIVCFIKKHSLCPRVLEDAWAAYRKLAGIEDDVDERKPSWRHPIDRLRSITGAPPEKPPPAIAAKSRTRRKAALVVVPAAIAVSLIPAIPETSAALLSVLST